MKAKVSVRRFIILFVGIVFFNICNAQNKPISLYVEDENREPVTGATVSLINVSDSTIVSAKITDLQGKVTFNVNPAQPLIVNVRSLGYETYAKPLKDIAGPILLQPSSEQLSEVTVTARAESLQHKAGKFIFDPAELIKEMPYTYDVLRFTPLVEVSEGTYSILGKGQSTVYINGRSTNMSTSDLTQMLKTLPSNQIKSIEIITAPGASHSASMSGGIINIILDKPANGYLGSVGTTVNYYNERVSPAVSSWNSFTKDKLSLTASLTYQGYATNSKDENEYDYTGENTTVLNKSSSSTWSNRLNANIKAAYFLTSKSELGAQFNIGTGEGHGRSVIESLTQKKGEETKAETRINSKSPWLRPSYNLALYYTLNTDNRGSNLDITAGYGNGITKTGYDYLFPDNPECQTTDLKTEGYYFVPKYYFAISDKHSVNVGYSILRSRVNYDEIREPYHNNFIYKEMINSGFAEWNASWSESFNTKIGLRLENTDISGNQVISNEKFDRNYTDLFPSASFSVKLPLRWQHRISISVERGIYRPTYYSLNPYTTWTSETTCERGNIDLKPSYSMYYTLYYSFLKDFILSCSYSFSPATMANYQYNEGDVTVASVGNFGKSKNVYNTLSYSHKFFDFWRIKATLYAYYSNSKVYIDNADLSFVSWMKSFGITNNFQLFKSQNINFELDYRYKSPSQSYMGKLRPSHHISVSLSKYFTNGLQLSLNAFNLINNHVDYNFSSPEYSYRQKQKMYSGYFTLRIGYVFGKRTIKQSNKFVEPVLELRKGSSD